MHCLASQQRTRSAGGPPTPTPESRRSRSGGSRYANSASARRVRVQEDTRRLRKADDQKRRNSMMRRYFLVRTARAAAHTPVSTCCPARLHGFLRYKPRSEGCAPRVHAR
jgi:hypothetical protein